MVWQGHTSLAVNTQNAINISFLKTSSHQKVVWNSFGQVGASIKQMRRELVNNKPCTAPILEQQIYSSSWVLFPVGLGFTVPGDTLRKTSVGRDQTNALRPSERAVVEFLPCHTGFLAGFDPLWVLALLSQSCCLALTSPEQFSNPMPGHWEGPGLSWMWFIKWESPGEARAQLLEGASGLLSTGWDLLNEAIGMSLMSFGKGRTSIGCVSFNWISSFLPSPLPYWVA